MRTRISSTQYPKCKTCGHTVKGRDNRFCSPACVPKSIRQDNYRRGRKTFAYRRRALCFRSDLERLGRSFSREELLTVFWTVYKRGYVTGFKTGRAGSSFQDAVERGAA